MKIGQHRLQLIRRVGFLNGLVQVALLLVALSYWWVQIAQGESYRELAENNRLRRISLEAPRGLIYDRHGRQLVENVPSYTLLLDRSLSHDLDASLEFAAGVLGVDAGELRRRLAESPGSKFRQVRLATRLDLVEVARFRVEQLEHPEFEIAAEHLRLNRHAQYTAHLMGYLGRVTKEDLETQESDFSRDDLLGRQGIEGRYEDYLRGERGEQLVVVDSRGRLIEKLEPALAHSGGDLRLTLDLDLQQEAARLLEGKVGAVVALDPRQGDVLALYSSPSFDPNAFARGLSPEEWQALSQDPRRPLQNRAMQPMAPGSIFKIVMALAALDRAAVTPETRVFCAGSTQLYDHRRRCWNSGGHGWENLERALRDSCDIYFYQLGQKLGIETIAHYARLFGFGRSTGIALPGEKAGLVPDPQWSERVRGTRWYPGETISVAIGQGPILVTPLQAAVMMGALARGYLVEPRLVLDEPVRRGEPLPFRPEHLELVRGALWKVVNDPQGTGRTAHSAGLDVAGKTGTAQVVRQETWTKNEELPPELRDHAWFVGYAPAGDPRLVVVVFVEHGGGGSKVAAPLARQLFEAYFARPAAAPVPVS